MKNIMSEKCRFFLLGLACILLAPHFAMADVDIQDDVIVERLCVGIDCSDGENFNNDVIMKLKANNLRIFFDDTSALSSFPRNDWRIAINDTANGGDNYFAIEDATAATMPFRLDAAAGDNSIYLTENGWLGLGTNNPSATLDVQGNAFIAGNLELGSSRAYKFDIRSLDASEAREALMGLRPVRFYHKSDPAEETLGFIAEEVPNLVATAGRTALNPVDIVAVLTRVMQEQQETIDDLARRVEKLEREVCPPPEKSTDGAALSSR